MKRFHEAQASSHAGYAAALSEIRAGGKRSHWIWYIFPQLAGLGRSSTARFYALRDLDEAQSYLSDPAAAGSGMRKSPPPSRNNWPPVSLLKI